MGPAGVLCLELLKQWKSPESARLVLSRSETIQNLTLTLAFLDWVRPTAGNYQLCQRMRSIIGRVLDQILDTPPPSQDAPQDIQPLFDLEIPSDWPDYEELGNLNYFENFDWVGAL